MLFGIVDILNVDGLGLTPFFESFLETFVFVDEFLQFLKIGIFILDKRDDLPVVYFMLEFDIGKLLLEGFP